MGNARIISARRAGAGDWGLGVRAWMLGVGCPIPNPQSPTPDPPSEGPVVERNHLAESGIGGLRIVARSLVAHERVLRRIEALTAADAGRAERLRHLDA